jgi:hypothetical protein
MIPLTVTATMTTGIAHSLPWGIALDGILASALWYASKPAATHIPALDADNPPDLDLPLARCLPPAGPWHWAATCSWPDPAPIQPDVHYWTSRVDHRSLEHLTAALPKVISDRQGRWKAHRMPLITYPCRTLTWSAVGDPDQIRALLATIPAIGKKRSQGEGQVLAWDVSPAPHLDAFTAAHLTPTGELGRPVPPACLIDRHIATSGLGLAAIRPPSMHPSRLHELHLPAPVMS